jgi:glycosyltransferase involved in cell wall biosynthesis
MIIADFCAADTGGQSYKLTRAINEYSDNEARSFVKEKNYIDFPADILMGSQDKDYVIDYLSKCEIVHCHNKFRYANGWAHINRDAKWIIHQHGRFPENQDMEIICQGDNSRRALRVVSTPNLIKYVNDDPERWIPAPYRISELEMIKKINYIPHEKIRLAHSPTNREIKDTELLIKACSEIPDIELVLIEGRTHRESLIMRSGCDITFDQLKIGYGNSAIEGMCFGQPVIAGMNDYVKDFFKNYIGYEPYVVATAETLKDILIEFVKNEGKRNLYGKLGNDYVREWHDDKNVINRVLSIYRGL